MVCRLLTDLCCWWLHMQGYHPSLVLVSKQVLLALSPLHHQVLPRPAAAHLLPSSFPSAVGKALMQQLFDAPVLDGFEHEGCSLQLWHVWWHVRLRVYGAQQQQAAFSKQLQEQQQAAAAKSRQAGKSRGSSKSSSRGQRDQSSKPSNNISSGSTVQSAQQSFVWQGLSSSQLEALHMDPDARWVQAPYCCAGGCLPGSRCFDDKDRAGFTHCTVL